MYTDGQDGGPVLGVAERAPDISSDGLVWTFHLRPEVWSDGVPVSAQDFVFAYRRILDPKTASSYAYLDYLLKNGAAVNAGKAPLEAVGAKALDDHTLQLTLEHPAPFLPQLLKHQAFFPVPEHVVERYGDAWSQPGHFVGAVAGVAQHFVGVHAERRRRMVQLAAAMRHLEAGAHQA